MNANKLALLPLLLTMQFAQSVEFPQFPFSHNDWEIACDNTRTCRAAAYQADEADHKATILLTRRAGPSEPIRIQLQLADTGEGFPSSLLMRIDGRAFGTVTIDDHAIGDLSPAQTNALLAALPKNTLLSWTAKRESWTVSTKGANAVLLKDG
jgi:hypothetical protein